VSSSAIARIICPNCQKENTGTRRFCGECGRALWEKCVQCGSECPVDERFCGACGVDVSAARHEQQQQCAARIEEALALAASHQYDAALTELRCVAAISDPKLQTFVARAVAELKKIEQTQATGRDNAQTLFNEAKQLIAGHAYERAQATLEQTPESLQNQEYRDLLTHIRSCRTEILKLGGEIRAAVEEKRIADLAPKLEMLLALKPDHKQAFQLSEQLRDLKLKAAKALLTKHKYQQAYEELQLIPSVVVNNNVETLVDTSSELAGLLSAVEKAPFADRETLALADRLCRLAPKNPDAPRLRDQLQERAKQKPATPRSRSPNWAPIPQRTWVDAPVDELTCLSRATTANDDVAKVLTKHPGQYFVALGLALQALECAAIEADLTPRKEASGIAKLAGMTLGRRSPTTAWGIDLSDASLKAVKLTRAGNDALQIDQAQFVQHRQRPESTDFAPEETVSATLRDFAASAGDLKNVSVCIGLAGHRVLGRFLELPPVPAKKVSELVLYEARHQFPMGLEELCWSYAVFDSAEGKTTDDQLRRLALQAARESHIRERMSRFTAAGLTVESVQSDCVALHNALVFELFAEEKHESSTSAIAAVHIGPSSTDVVVSAPDHLWFRSFGTGASDMIRALMRELTITADQALELLYQPARAKRYRRWANAVEPIAVHLAGEVQRSLVNYHKLFSDHPVRQVFVLGEGPIGLVLRVLRTGG